MLLTRLRQQRRSDSLPVAQARSQLKISHSRREDNDEFCFVAIDSLRSLTRTVGLVCRVSSRDLQRRDKTEKLHFLDVALCSRTMSSIVDSPVATSEKRKSKKARKSAPTEDTPAPSSLSKKKRKIAHQDATVIQAVEMEVEATVEVESAAEVESSPVKTLSKAEKGKDKKKMKEQAKALVSPVTAGNIGTTSARYSGGVAAVQELIGEYCVAGESTGLLLRHSRLQRRSSYSSQGQLHVMIHSRAFLKQCLRIRMFEISLYTFCPTRKRNNGSMSPSVDT